jgi:hypothetical protein
MEKIQTVDYYQHVIPTGRNIVPNANLVKTIIIRSKERDITKYPNKFDFVLYLENYFTDVISIEIIKAYFNSNIPIITNKKSTVSIYIELIDENLLSCSNSIEFIGEKIGVIKEFDKDEIEKTFNDFMDNNIFPKIQNYMKNLSYILSGTSHEKSSQLYIPKFYLKYNEKINKFFIYKLSSKYIFNNNYLSFSKPINNFFNFELNKECFRVFGVDMLKNKNSKEYNPNNKLLKNLGFSNRAEYDCNKFLLNKGFELNIEHTEYLGTDIKMSSIKFISKNGDEFLLVKSDDNRYRLFLIDSPQNNNETPYLIVNNYTTKNDNFKLESIADKIYFNTSQNYIVNKKTGIINNCKVGVIDYTSFYKQMPIELSINTEINTDEHNKKLLSFIFNENKYFIASYGFLKLYSTNNEDFYKNNQMIYGDNEFIPPELFKLSLEGDILSNGYCERFRYVEINRYYKMNKNIFAQINIKPKFYYTMSLDIDRNCNKFLTYQLENALCINDNNLGMQIEYTNIKEIFLPLNTNYAYAKYPKKCKLHFSLSQREENDDTSIEYDNELYKYIENISKINVIYSNNKTIEKTHKYSTKKFKKGLLGYEIKGNILRLKLGVLSTDLELNDNKSIGEVNLDSTESFYYRTITGKDLTVNTFENLNIANINIGLDYIENITNIDDIALINNAEPFKFYNELNSLTSYYEAKDSLAIFDVCSIKFRDKYLEDVFGSNTNYKYKNDIIIKPIVPFTGDKLYKDENYDNFIVSLNYFIADKLHKLIKSDYFLLDINEINNKYSNSNEIEKHTFLEIPTNFSSIIYYESTNIGYSTREFNPPIKQLTRLTLRIRDNDGNILENDCIQNDYTLIMNVKEINNSTNKLA